MYCDYWNLTKPPFDNVPDASMYVDCHESMENVISETLFAIKEGNECLTVIVGEVGLGKTLSLRVIIDSLEPEKYKVALITNPALSFVQLLREIIGQITGKQCEVKNKVDLLEIFNRLLFETADQGRKIVIVIDEANVLSPSNLDDLRLLTNMQDDERNLFTLLLVGQMEFAKTLEHPKRANLFQRIGTYGHLEKLPSPEAVRTYIESRLRIAGTDRKIFDDDAIPVIWEFSEHGVPRLINKICKLCIKAGETNEFQTISGDVAQQIADRFQKLSKTSAQKRKAPAAEAQPAAEAPRKQEPERIPKPSRPAFPEKETPAVSAPVRPAPPRMEEPAPMRPRMAPPEQPPARPTAPPVIDEAPPVRPRPVMPEQPPMRRPLHPGMEDLMPPRSRMAPPEQPPVSPAPPRMEEPAPMRPRMAAPEEMPLRPTAPPVMDEAPPVRPRPVMPEQPPVSPAPPRMEEPAPMRPRMAAPEEMPAYTAPVRQEEPIPVRPQAVPVPPKPSASVVPPPVSAPGNVAPPQGVRAADTAQQSYEEQPMPMEAVEEEDFEEVTIGQQSIKLAIPSHVIRQAQSSNKENKNKLAGYWSAQILKGNPQLTHSSFADPVSLWFEVKNVILKKFNSPAHMQ